MHWRLEKAALRYGILQNGFISSQYRSMLKTLLIAHVPVESFKEEKAQRARKFVVCDREGFREGEAIICRASHSLGIWVMHSAIDFQQKKAFKRW